MKINIWKNPVSFTAITAVFIIIARVIEYFIHESGHYLAARIIGILIQPDPVQAVLTSPVRITLLKTGVYGFSESFQYLQYTPSLLGSQVAFIAVAGLLLNALIAVLCIWIFLRTRLIKYKSLITLTLWVLIFNLGALFSYIPLQVFSTNGDVGYFLSSLWVHPVIFLFPTVILTAMGLILYYTVIAPLYCMTIPVQSKFLRIGILLCSTLILFMYMTVPIFTEFKYSDILTLSEITTIFPFIVTGQCIFLVALILAGIVKINSLHPSRFLGTKKKVQ